MARTPKLTAQAFTEAEILQGCAQRDDKAYFIFSPAVYGVKAKKVDVTGTFRGWDTNMDTDYALKERKDKLWVVAVPNDNYTKIPPHAEYKFRINEGEWLSAPVTAIHNAGNLVFMKGAKPRRLRAELRRSGTVWATIDGIENVPFEAKAFRLTNSAGKEIPIAGVLPNTASEIVISPAEAIDIKRVYWLEFLPRQMKAVCTFDGWFRDTYSTKELGANISPDGKRTDVRLFAPRAEMVKLYLYKGANDNLAYQTIEMKADKDGVWEASFNENLKGIYYDFTVHGSTDEGNLFYETKPVHISDPYARVCVDSWGKSRIWERTKPATPLKNGRPAMQDVIAYEVHIEDFTNTLPLPADQRGKIPAFTKSGLKNKKGEKIGFDYLTDLGVNTIHLLPVQEFLHWKSDDWKASFENDEYMKLHGVNLESYEWGYRTTHAFAVESNYRQGTNHGDERNQFRDLVQAFHDKGMAVIIDIVPNHTGENMDGQNLVLHFNGIDMQYYYRTKDLKHIGEYGNEVKTENRPMTQRWLIDQCTHWINEFGIDGFRIDLAGQIDQQTLKAVRQAVGKDVIIYGEPWIASNDPDYEANPDWDWYKADAPITFFQDDSRNAFKGPVSNPTDKKKDRGYAGGDFTQRDKVKKGLACTFPEDKTPLSGINYLDIHDNWALADQFATTDWNGLKGVDEQNFKIAALLLYTSQGPIVTHGGTEIMRSKGMAELKEVVKESKGGVKAFFHGKRDTYNQRNANLFLWETVGKTKKESPCNYKSMHAFWRGLNRFRSSEKGKVFRNAEALPAEYYDWIEPENPAQLGYIVDRKVIVLINVDETANIFPSVQFPEGTWKLIGNNFTFDHINGAKDADKKIETIQGGKPQAIRLAGVSFKVWVKE